MQAETIPALVREAARRFGPRAFLEDDAGALSFAALAGEALAATRGFLAHGIEPGDRVAIQAPNLREWILAALGAQGAGAAIVPINTRFKGAETAYVLRKSGARMLCTVAGFLGTDYPAQLGSESLPALEAIVMLRGESQDPRAQSLEDFVVDGVAVGEAAARRRSEAVAPDDLSDLLFTSGTTGRPKGVMTTHAQNLRAFASWSELVGLRAEDRYLIVNPFFHAFGYKAGWLACLLTGATALPHLVFDVPEVLRRIPEDRVSVLPGPPTLYQSLLAHPDLAAHELSSLRLAVTGAAAIPVELVRRMRGELGFETVITGYGLTECCGIVSMCREGDDPETIATTSGRAIPGVAVRCVDARGSEVPHGEPGEVVVRGYNLMRGYFEDEAATRETIDAEGWLHTGDVGVMDAKRYLRITDRIKDLFICGGFNAYPAEIESLLFEHPAIAQAAVIGVPDARLGEVAMAFVQPVQGATLEPADVIAWARGKMANYKVPRRVEIVEALPTNAAGKVTKFVLRERSAAPAR